MKIANILFNYKKSTNKKNSFGGVERCFIDYTKHLMANGNELLSITKPNMIFAGEVKKTGSQFYELKAANKADIFSMFNLAVKFFLFKPDAVICHSGRALFFARVAKFFLGKKFPIIAIDHGSNPKKFLKADYVLTVNSYFSQQLVDAGKPRDRALVIPNMIEVPLNFISPVKQKFHKPVKIGSLGRLGYEKYFDKILRAMAILRERGIESEYVIGGIGPMEKSLKDLAQELKLENNFKILGWIEDKSNFFDLIDIFILPSVCETFGIVLLEAMLYSTPIITSNSWGPDEVIDHEVNGLKVSKDDEKEMPKLIADAIERLTKNEDFARNLAVRAKEKFFSNYSSQVVAKKLNEIIEMAIKEVTNAK